DRMVSGLEQVGMTNGLAVYGNNNGIVIEVEVFAAYKTGGSKKINVAGANNTASLSEKTVFENGELKITGIIEQEEIQGRNQRFRRTSAARSSIENVLTVLRKYMGIDCRRYDLHVNFPGGIPLDGPSAGLAIAAAIFSAISGLPVRGDIAMTGEVSICGKIKPVGGVPAKVEAARLAGIKKVIVPEQNFSSNINVNINSDIDCNSFEVLPVNDFLQAMTIIFGSAAKQVEMLLPSGTPSLPGLSL
ncbi:MAG: S16 family serine protease, partial [Clostridiales bacterium]|nr:S16 family serine protease [Clostridiales bacterium]